MESMPVVCTECARQKELLEAGGMIKVDSCKPDPARPGVCNLLFDYTFTGSAAKAAKKAAAKKASTKKAPAKKSAAKRAAK